MLNTLNWRHFWWLMQSGGKRRKMKYIFRTRSSANSALPISGCRIVHIGHRVSINDSTNDISSKIVRVSRSSRVRTQRGTYNYVKDETWKRTSSGKKWHEMHSYSNKKRFALSYLIFQVVREKERKVNRKGKCVNWKRKTSTRGKNLRCT